MATVKQLYTETAKALNAEVSWTMQGPDGKNPQLIHGKISYLLEEHTRYWSFYFPEGCPYACVEYVLRMPDTARCVITEEIPVQQTIGFANSPERYDLSSLPFSGRIYLYIDAALTQNERNQIVELGESLSLSIVIRDRNYLTKLVDLAKPQAFISHDSRDKDALVRPLAEALSIRLCSVWYDEYSLKVGDSLRENIERGLREAKKCIVILSPSFIANGGWTKAEFDSIYTREIHERTNVILPVWHNISKDAVYEYCPRLVDRMALSSSIGVGELAQKLAQAITKD